MTEKTGIGSEHRVLPAIWAGATALQLSGMDSRLYGAARLLAAAKTGTLKVEEADITLKVHGCTYDYVEATVRCPLTVYGAGEVPVAAVDAALAELRRGPAAAGSIILWNGRHIEPAPPVFRKFVRKTISIINDNTDIIIEKLRTWPTAAAAVLAAVEVGNWITIIHSDDVVYSLIDDIKHDNIPLNKGEIETTGGRITVFLPYYDNHIAVGVVATHPPRAREREFGVAYNKWYKRAASAARLLPYPRY